MLVLTGEAPAERGYLALAPFKGAYIVGIIDDVNEVEAVVCWEDFRVSVPRYTFMWARPFASFRKSAGSLVGKRFESEEDFDCELSRHSDRH